MSLLRLLLLSGVLAVMGCSSLRPWQNQPMKPLAPMVQTTAQSQAVRDPALLMFLSMSGGGARAAAFGYGVMEALWQTRVNWQGRDIRLLDEVDVISGVSGGSIAAAYFAAFGHETFPRFEQTFLRRNFQLDLIHFALRPANMYDLSSPWFGRSNLLERRLDDLYQGKTFGDLSQRTSGPSLLISATDLSLGAPFEFTWRQFSLICSDLDTVPLSFAVAASSAVPLALSPLTLKNYNASCARTVNLKQPLTDDYRVRLLRDSQRSYLNAEERPYIHLVDGGLSDNLGLRSLLDRAQAAGGLRDSVRVSGKSKIQKLVIVAVNAERSPSEQVDLSDQVPGTLQVLDTLVFGAGARASHETQGMLQDAAQAWRRELKRQLTPEQDPFSPDAEIYLINVNLRDAPDASRRSRLLQVPTAFSVSTEDVTGLIHAGHELLVASPEFQRLLLSLQSNLGRVDGSQ
jgi:NTE family protein